MKDISISDAVLYVGADDKTLDIFESQYPIPNGVSYNSYVIMDEKITVMDTVDKRATDEWFANLARVLGDKKPAYLVVSHMEPDHAANIKNFADRYPEAKLVGNAKTFAMMDQFFEMDLTDRKVVVKEGETLSLGAHTLQFFMAPMVHWPEVMVAYEQSEKILFSADGFGKFGALDAEEEWDEEAARYFLNIVGKYGVQVQGLLKKASGLDIQMICPLHGPVWRENLEYLLSKYATTTDQESINAGVKRVRDILADNYVHREEANLIQSKIREKGRYQVIDKVQVALNEKLDRYEATFENLGISRVVVDSITVDKNPKLLVTGIWCMCTLVYAYSGDRDEVPWRLHRLMPVQMSHDDRENYLAMRAKFTAGEWIDLLMQSVGFNPDLFGDRAKLLHLVRMIPFVERNYNLIELGPKGTGKSHIYSEFSPHGMLISGGEDRKSTRLNSSHT